MSKKSISLGSDEEAKKFLLQYNPHLELIEKKVPVKIIQRGNVIQIIGRKKYVEKTTKFLNRMINFCQNGNELSVEYMEKNIINDKKKTEILTPPDVLFITTRGKHIKAKTKGQELYIKALREYDMVFSIGPAGTGKTYLAVAKACLALKENEISRIILTRPAVEAGEKLGFLPGDMQAKVDPYFRPLYDALFDMMDVERFLKYLERGIIEIAPLAYMRGRTLNDAYVILDEAQNTTTEQMKMFLTRMGFSSKVIVTGDITQIDLPEERPSGLMEIQKILKGIKGIKFVYLTEQDVVRHELVQKIILAYEKYGRKYSSNNQGKT